jgi:hypothetical protein
LLLIVAAGLAGSILPCLVFTAAAGATQPAEWTVMVYMNGDNDLEKWVAHDIEREMGAVGSSEAVQVVALADRSPGYDKTHGDWQGTLLFHVVKGQLAAPDQAVADWGERNMGSPQTLVDFIEWTRASYPAERYALVLWDHAWSWRPSYLSWDESSNDALDLPGLRLALDRAGAVDVVGFDTCASQCVEGQAELRGYADAVAASEDFTGYTGFDYARVLAELQAKPALGALGCAKVFARSMSVKPDRWTNAASAVRLDGAWDELLFAVDRLSWRLRDALRRHRPAIRAARAATWKSPGDATVVDLYGMARELRARVPVAGVRAACRDVMQGVREVVGYNWARGPVRGARGISIYWPYGPGPHHEPAAWWNFTYYASMLTWSQECGWDEFLAAWGR